MNNSGYPRRLVCRTRPLLIRITEVCLFASIFVSSASAQFQEIGAAPFASAEAHQKIRTLLRDVNPDNRAQTVTTLTAWADWYRDILDEEMISLWKTEDRVKLPLVMESLADPHVASEIVEFGWRQNRQSSFNLVYAPMLGNLMARYPESAGHFLEDLLGPITRRPLPELSQSEAEGVCRILLDMPDDGEMPGHRGTWRQGALQILPNFRPEVRNLLDQDLRSSDREKIYRAERWSADLKIDVSEAKNDSGRGQRRSVPPANPVESSALRTTPAIAANTAIPPNASARPALARQDTPVYNGPGTGTLACSGSVPGNAEYVFRDLPAVKLRLDYDAKVWEATLEPAGDATQRVVLRNKTAVPQKKCTVHWTVIQ